MAQLSASLGAQQTPLCGTAVERWSDDHRQPYRDPVLPLRTARSGQLGALGQMLGISSGAVQQRGVPPTKPASWVLQPTTSMTAEREKLPVLV